MRAIPVIALTGYLGAGKTSLLNHVLRAPHARIGVVINDFGDVNVDATLVTGQVDEPVSIEGGCVCCLDEDNGLDEALDKLTDPRLALDARIGERNPHAHVVGAIGARIDPALLYDVSGSDDDPGQLSIRELLIDEHADRHRHGYVVNVVGSSVHVAAAPAKARTNCLVAIGTDLDVGEVLDRVDAALRPRDGSAGTAGLWRLQRYRKLSL